MKKIYNPKLILYLFLPFVGMFFGCLFFVVENYVFGSVFLGLSFVSALLFILFVPNGYFIDKEGIRIFYGFKKCNTNNMCFTFGFLLFESSGRSCVSAAAAAVNCFVPLADTKRGCLTANSVVLRTNDVGFAQRCCD